MIENDELRRRAERVARERAGEIPEKLDDLSSEDIRRIIHELRVHQIELEMQNEELRQAQMELFASRARYFDLYELAPVGYLTLNGHGLILEANLTAATLLGEARRTLARQPLTHYIFKEDQDVFYLHRKYLLETTTPQKSELRMVKKDGTVFWGHLETTIEKNADGEPVWRAMLGDITDRKRAEEALRESEERYRALVDLAVDGILLGSHEGNIIEANKCMCQIVGVGQEDLIGRHISALPFTKESLAKSPFRFDLLKKGETVISERMLIRPDGSEVSVEMRTRTMPDGSYQSIYRDITERKKAEEALQQSEQRLRSLADNLPNAMVYQIMAEPDGGRRFTYVSGGVERLNEVTAESLLNDAGVLYKQILPEHLEIVREREEEALRNITTMKVEVQSRLPSGRLRWFEYASTPRYLPDGLLVWDGVEVDITERKWAEEMLRDSEQRFRQIFDGSRDGFVMVDTSQRITNANRAYCEMLGYTLDELQMMETFYQVTPEQWHQWEKEEIWRLRLLQVGYSGVYEKEYIRKDGTVFPVELQAYAAFRENGNISYLWAVARDITERKKAENALRLFMESVENASDAIGMSTPEGKHYYQNAAFTKLFGKIGDDPPSTLYVDEVVGRKVFQTIMTGKRWAGEVSMYAKDRRVVDILLRAYPIKNSDGRVTGLVGIHTDFTERKAMENALRESEQRMRQIVENAPFGAHLYELGPEKQLVFTGANSAADAILGVNNRKFVGKTIEEAFPSLKQTDIPENYRRVAATGGQFYREWVDYTDESFHGAYEVSAFQTGPNRLAAFFRDITERKRSEDALRESERKLSTLIGNLHGMVYFCLNDPDWTMKFVSEGAFDLTGYLPDELVDNTLVSYNDIIYPDDRQMLWEMVQDSLTIRSPYTLEYRIITKKGAVKWVWERGRGIFLPDGEPHHLEGFIADITERKALEDRLRQTQKMESIGRLAGGVAHDFNNMLGVILGFVELTLNKIESTHPMYDDLLEIRKAAQRSAGLTRQLLTFASIQPAAPKILDLNETVEGMLKMLRRLIGEAIHLVWHRGAGLWPVKVDPSQIDQILVNLCVNARDAISGPGNVTIETRNASFDEDFCSEHPDAIPGDYVHLAVSDDGCGMDRETLVNIFEPFFTTKGLGEGTGLGLATVYGIVRQNNGFIDVRSAPGAGTTFNIYLPRHTILIAEASALSEPEPLKMGKETILLVEDEPAVLKVTEMMLAHLGYRVLAADTPHEAFRIARKHAGEIDLLMTDVIMPEINGKDLASQLQSLCPRVKRLFMSGYMADIITPDDALAEGVYFIQKPFTIKALAARVREVLDQ